MQALLVNLGGQILHVGQISLVVMALLVATWARKREGEELDG